MPVNLLNESKKSGNALNDLPQHTSTAWDSASAAGKSAPPRDYSYVRAPARIACYDDLRSAPRITEVPPAGTAEFIESLASGVYTQAREAGGGIPYTVIREVVENFIHADFTEIVVSILDGGDTIRFADQGPGIAQKDKAQLPGFTSATEPMKRYIRGVGSGLPIVKEYLDISHGVVTIEDNLTSGAVVTVSLAKERNAGSGERAAARKVPLPQLSARERTFLSLLVEEGPLGVTELSKLTDVPASSTHVLLTKMEQSGLVEKTAGQKRIPTDYGCEVFRSL